MKQVSTCPHCGAPIYMPNTFKAKQIPAPTYTCQCHLKVGPAPYYVPYYVSPTTPPNYTPSWYEITCYDKASLT